MEMLIDENYCNSYKKHSLEIYKKHGLPIPTDKQLNAELKSIKDSYAKSKAAHCLLDDVVNYGTGYFQVTADGIERLDPRKVFLTMPKDD